MRIQNTLAPMFISAALLLGSAPAALAAQEVPIILSFDDVDSEVLAWSWGASQSGSSHAGGGGSAGNASFQDISITRLVDSQSPDFLRYVARGSNISRAALTRGALQIEFNHVLVTSYSVSGTADKKSPQTENITLNFQEVRYQIGDGEFCWDVLSNSTCSP